MLQQYSGQSRFIIRSAIAGRNLLQFEETIGWFATAIAFKIDLTTKETIQEILEENKKQIMGAHNNQNVPNYHLKQIMDAFHPMQFCRVFLNVHNYPIVPESFRKILQIEAEPIEIDTSEFFCFDDLRISVSMRSTELRIGTTFKDTVFDDEEQQKVSELFSGVINDLHRKDSCTVLHDEKVLGQCN